MRVLHVVGTLHGGALLGVVDCIAKFGFSPRSTNALQKTYLNQYSEPINNAI